MLKKMYDILFDFYLIVAHFIGRRHKNIINAEKIRRQINCVRLGITNGKISLFIQCNEFESTFIGN